MTSFLIVISASVSFGQENNFAKNYVPPSPTAASLGKYGEIPVSYYTGVPGISIPLYSVKSGELEMPISISYHAGGVKVSEESSWLGLGWSLNAGGVITRQVVGLDDFVNNGYIGAEPIPAHNSSYANPNYASMYLFFGTMQPDRDIPLPDFGGDQTLLEKYELMNNGSLDAQPDLFFYNFLGYSGKLLFEKQPGNVVKAIAIDQNNLDFSYDKATKKWIVTDGNGWKFHFGTTEITRTLSQSAGYPITTPPSGTESLDIESAWYLDKIASPDGDEINFSYGHTGRFINSPAFFDESYYKSSDLIVNNDNGFVFSNFDPYVGRYTSSITRVDEAFLQRIDFSNGYILFNKSDRQDRIASQFSAASPALTSMEIFDLSGALNRKIEFTQSYFNPDRLTDPDKELYLRLRLDQVHEKYKLPNGTYVSVPPYIFSYNETPLPKKNAHSFDLWGYNNGRSTDNIRGYKFIDRSAGPSFTINQELTTTRSYLIPMYMYAGAIGGQNLKIFVNGANRDPHSDNMQAGILKGIQYPLGGFTSFAYEPHDYYYQGALENEEVIETVNSAGTTEKTFSLSRPTFICVDFELVNHAFNPSLPNDPAQANVMYNMTAVLEKTDGTDILKFIPSDTQMDGTPGGSTNVDQMKSYVVTAVDPGDYRIKTTNGGFLQLDMTMKIKYIKQVQTSKKLAGGLRIKSIDSYKWEGGEKIQRKVFKYEENNQSTGRLMSAIQTIYNETDVQGSVINPTAHGNSFEASIISPSAPVGYPNYIAVWSGNVLPMGSSAQGSSVGYDKVFVASENEDGETQGTSTYQYRNIPEVALLCFPGLPNRVNNENGQLMREQHFNTSGTLVKEKVLTYYKGASVTLTGVKTMTFFTPWGVHSDWIDYSVPTARYYFLDSEWWHPYQTVETTYDVNGANPITETIDYAYENATHKQLTKTTKLTSDGKTLVVTSKYPSDSPTGTQTSASTLNSMISANMLNPVIKQETTLNGTLVQGLINNYSVDPHAHIKPSSIEVMQTTQSYETRFLHQQYDSDGNLLQFQNTDGIITSYVWSYQNAYPVAKAEGVDYVTLKSAIESASGTTNLESFWSSFSSITYSNAVWKNFNTALRNDPALNGKRVWTYTYAPLLGTTSESDMNGRITFYEYDNFKRLKLIRAHDGAIQKVYDYSFTD